ncbi:uncharacterized protein LOC102368925 isoform X2 [Alligator sinensis]|uniref:Uncharacterized protein LOC102368925 isoform X2 n=1 Tax=Alligator sinensis TaxID=38654 RepID=A0A3Q0G013_ALLSI|nr:uncharacterized protein LOC102368925 isoform X2 [Alligator sinensis]
MAAELEPASAAGFPFPAPVQPVVKVEEQDPTDPEPWVGAERAGNAPCVVRASPRCPAAPVVKQEPVEEPILCWRVTGNGQLKEGPEALAGFLCSGLEQPQPHPGHVPKEEAEWGETPGPQEELPCVPKEEPLFQQEPDSPDTDETWDSADESSLGCFPRRGSWRGAEPSTWEAAVTNPKLEQGAADRTRRKTVNSPAVQGLRKRKTVLTSGRKRDSLWEYFEEIPSLGKKGKRAKCKQCKREMQGLVARMKRHRDNCLWGENDVDEDVDVSEEQCGSTGSHLSIRDFDWLCATTSESSVGPLSSSAAIKRISDHKVSVASKRFQSSSKTTTVDGFVVRTGKCQQDPIDEKIARFIYATNSPFRIVHNTCFVEMVECLRPGYTPPGRADVGGRLLDTVYKKELERCARNTAGKFASLSLAGWSDIPNDPVICACVRTEDGVAYLSEIIDTSGNAHTAEYFKDVAVRAVINCEQKFNCHVRSVVTDSAANVAKMRRCLEDKTEGCFLIAYGCSAHLMHLLAEDLGASPDIKEDVVEVAKYFRNNHFASASLKRAGGCKPILPHDVGWRAAVDCLEQFITSRPVLIKICEENRDKIDGRISSKVSNMGFKRSVEDMLGVLKPISIALSKLQSECCCIADAVEIWKALQETLKKEIPNQKVKLEAMKKRMDQALTPPHFLANALHP